MTGDEGGAVVIRQAVAADVDAVAALVDAMGGHDGATGNPAVGAVYREALGCHHIRMLVAEEAGRVVGYAEVQARPSLLDGVRQGWLAALAVAPGMRGRGVGAALVEAVDAAAAALGCGEVVVESSEFRRDAHRFYAAAGFVERRPARRFARPVRSDPSPPTRRGMRAGARSPPRDASTRCCADRPGPPPGGSP